MKFQMPKFVLDTRVNWYRVAVKSINWSIWVLCATLSVALVAAYVGDKAAGNIIGICLGFYLVAWAVTSIVVEGDVQYTKRTSKSSSVELDQHAQSHADSEIVVQNVRA